MIDQPLSLPNELLDWGALSSAQVDLSSEQIERAAQVSRSIQVIDQRWQVYLTALGVLGFEQWIQERAPELSIQIEQASIWNRSANIVSAASNLQVGAFKICVISVGSFVDDRVDAPIAVFDLPDFTAHFYVLVQVIEEEDKLSISGWLSYDQFRQMSCTAESDWTYALPISAFNSDPNALLLSLRCLESNSIRLPAIAVTRSSARLREKLFELRSQLQSQSAWDFLTLDEGLTLLNDPPLVNSLYESLYESETGSSIDVGLWFRNQLDSLAQATGWQLMPVFSAVRSIRDDFDNVRSSLEQQGVQISTSARGAYRTLRSQSGMARLYVITWLLSEASDQPEWMLLAALGSEPGTEMPRTLRLEIFDDTQLLFNQSLNDTTHSVLYAQVIGNYNEKFCLTVTANETDIFEIPSFGFQIDERLR